MGTKYLVDAATGLVWTVGGIDAGGDVCSQGKVEAVGKIIAGADVEGVNAVLSGNVQAVDGSFSGIVSGDSALFAGALSAVGGVNVGTLTSAGPIAGTSCNFDSVIINNPVTDSHHATTKEYVLASVLGFDWQLPIISFYDPTPGLPVGPANGDRYVATATANGWTIDNIYEWSTGGGVWVETAVLDRMALLNYADSTFYMFDNATSSWILLFMPSAHNDTLNKQGGVALEYYHLTAPEWATVNGGLALYDTDASDILRLVWNEASAAGRILNFLVNGADRSINLSDDLNVSAGCGTLDQSVANGASPTFNDLSITSMGSDWTNIGRTIADLGSVTTADINGGTIDGSSVAATTLSNSSGRAQHTATTGLASYDIDVQTHVILSSRSATGDGEIVLRSAQCVDGRVIVVKDVGGMAGLNNLTISTEGAETIDGREVMVIAEDYGQMRFISNGTNWFVL